MAARGPRRPAVPDVPEPQVPGPAEQQVTVDVHGLIATTGSLAALVRLRMAARRTGRPVTLRGASADLRELLELAGLSGEFEWEAEEGEEPRGVEE
jgi:ABC-type transporter Mla MlaB component